MSFAVPVTGHRSRVTSRLALIGATTLEPFMSSATFVVDPQHEEVFARLYERREIAMLEEAAVRAWLEQQ